MKSQTKMIRLVVNKAYYIAVRFSNGRR